ncbi:S8 family serine peptidase [Candidatus Rhodoluna planktonica]|uniref:Fibronectin type-III domain-containing protein n=1 Tax=Candidatus Rhodoluna planktonica TaxID=535712 RepID=A0A1D9E0H5_9MICO|nr:S8 family serine peptidase [Candidatus Rhodoluna planktonica]AOY56549.1 hypothetical protein A4Z71_06285 [Candidatus Rhodoluna planktonica]
MKKFVFVSAALIGSLVLGGAAMAAPATYGAKPSATPSANSKKPVTTPKTNGTDANTTTGTTATESTTSKPGASGNSNAGGKTAENNNTNDTKTNGNSGKTPSSTGTKTTGTTKTNGAKPAVDTGVRSNYIVRFAEGTDVDSESTAIASLKTTVSKKFKTVIRGALVRMTEKQKENVAKRANVLSIVPDGDVSTSETQSSPSWGLDRIDQIDMPLDASFSYAETGVGVTAYVVDTGVLTTHSEFTGRTAAGFSAISDGNGTIDCNGHGTHVASTIGGTIYGVAKGVTIAPVRVLGCDGSGTISGVIAGLDWIAANHDSSKAAVVNMSLGGGANSTLDAAVNNLIDRGITVVVAAGNNTADACTASPARVPRAITVAASSATDAFASYSNFGSCVDIIAPGSSITGAWFTSTSATATISGTSMATPHVAGIVARMQTLGAQLPAKISESLAAVSVADTISAVPTGTANAFIYGNPSGVSIPAAAKPLAAISVSATAGSRSATATWVLADNTAGPLTSQTVKLWAGNQLVRTFTVSATETSLQVTKLRTNTSYSFSVVANNAGGFAESARSNAVRPSR